MELKERYTIKITGEYNGKTVAINGEITRDKAMTADLSDEDKNVLLNMLYRFANQIRTEDSFAIIN
jgi:hypothetical protein